MQLLNNKAGGTYSRNAAFCMYGFKFFSLRLISPCSADQRWKRLGEMLATAHQLNCVRWVSLCFAVVRKCRHGWCIANGNTKYISWLIIIVIEIHMICTFPFLQLPNVTFLIIGPILLSPRDSQYIFCVLSGIWWSFPVQCYKATDQCQSCSLYEKQLYLCVQTQVKVNTERKLM